MRDDGFAGGSSLRQRNRAVGGERLADWEVWVKVCDYVAQLQNLNADAGVCYRGLRWPQ
jgi:hypothetical protein